MATQKTTCHARSNSLPSRPHSLNASIDDQLQRLRSCYEASSSSSSIFQNLSAIKDLYEDLNGLIQLPKNQMVLSDGVEEVLKGSLGLLDVCGSTMDVLSHVRDFILELKSSLRRKNDISGYIISRKKIIKMASKCFENLKKEEKNMQSSGISSLVRMLTEAEALCLSTLKLVLGNVMGSKVSSKGHGWSSVANLMKSKRVFSEPQEELNAFEKIDSTLKGKSSSIDKQALLKQLEALEMDVNEFTDGLESISRCLVKTRVSLLNVQNH